jgi:hypothetical protein
VALVNLLSDGSGALEEMRDRARDLGIVLDEALVRDAERARTELGCALCWPWHLRPRRRLRRLRPAGRGPDHRAARRADGAARADRL